MPNEIKFNLDEYSILRIKTISDYNIFAIRYDINVVFANEYSLFEKCWSFLFSRKIIEYVGTPSLCSYINVFLYCLSLRLCMGSWRPPRLLAVFKRGKHKVPFVIHSQMHIDTAAFPLIRLFPFRLRNPNKSEPNLDAMRKEIWI